MRKAGDEHLMATVGDEDEKEHEDRGRQGVERTRRGNRKCNEDL